MAQPCDEVISQQEENKDNKITEIQEVLVNEYPSLNVGTAAPYDNQSNQRTKKKIKSLSAEKMDRGC